jgi:hypothetical protein
MAGGLQRRAGKAACGKDARKDRRGAAIIADRGRAPAVVGRRAALREVLRCLADQIRTRRRGSSKPGRVELSIVEVRCQVGASKIRSRPRLVATYAALPPPP